MVYTSNVATNVAEVGAASDADDAGIKGVLAVALVAVDESSFPALLVALKVASAVVPSPVVLLVMVEEAKEDSDTVALTDVEPF